MPERTSEERFMELAADAVDGLPEWVHEAMDNVEVFVEDLPPPHEPGLLGLYHGVPLSKRGTHFGGATIGCDGSSRTRWRTKWRTISGSVMIGSTRSGRTSPCQRTPCQTTWPTSTSG